jgi:polyisoprenyl-teichoic acid--peptidoglycan teichoic acid transferase
MNLSARKERIRMSVLAWLRVIGILIALFLFSGLALFYGFAHRIYEQPGRVHGTEDASSRSSTHASHDDSPFGVGLAIAPLPPMTVLFLGVDSRKGEQARADTIMLAVVNPQRQDIHILPIPRDTYVQVPGHGYTKMNHAMFYGGVPLMKETVSRFLKEPVDYTVVLDFEGFKRVVDEMGGIHVFVEKDMDYDDPTDGTHIHLRRGAQVLNGKQALDYSRFRHDAEADTGRMRRQQQVLRAMIQEGKSVEHWPKWFNLTQILGDHVKTDVPPLTLIRLTKELAIGLSPEKIQTEYMHGVNQIRSSDGLWYFFVTEEERRRLHDWVERWTWGNESE